MSAHQKIRINNLSVRYEDDGTESLRRINLDIPANAITALFGPAGGGKSTLLRTLNRLNDLVDVSVSGEVLIDDTNILARNIDVVSLRRRVGIVFAQPTPLPFSIRQNIRYGLKLAGERRRARLDDAVEGSLRASALWDEVKDRLADPATTLSGGQQQRLCIARTIAVQPEVILMDEPCSALDPISTLAIEDLIEELKSEYTIVIVTHNMQQASRVSDKTAFFNIAGTGKPGKLIEYDDTSTIFSKPSEQATEDYVSGKFG